MVQAQQEVPTRALAWLDASVGEPLAPTPASLLICEERPPSSTTSVVSS